MRVKPYPLLMMAAAALALAGCKDTDRPLSYDKGVYAGKPDQELTSDQVEALRQRGTHQRQ